MGGRMAGLGLDNLVVKVHRTDLLAKLEANRAAHEEAYIAAVEGYNTAVVNLLKRELEKATNRISTDDADFPKPPPRLQVVLDPPKSFLDAYDTVISAYSMDTTQLIELELHQFRQIAEDKWEWKEDFLASTSRYVGG